MLMALPTRADPVLEHLARLAADVAMAPMAVVSLFIGQRDGAVNSGKVGFTKEQLNAIIAFDTIADPGTSFVVHDPTQDARFNFRTSSVGTPECRFLFHLRLFSPDGKRRGFICVGDEGPRPGLSETQTASLSLIANVVLEYRKREQRHAHLMHVANRALRIDKMLRLVSDATSCADALTRVLEELCRSHGALKGQILQLMASNASLVEVSRYNNDIPTRYDDDDCHERNVALDATVADTIRRNKPQAVRLSDGRTRLPLSTATPRGVACHLCIPVWVQQQRFGITLVFAGDHADLDIVAADIAALADAIRPALLRKVTEEQIRFVAHHDDLTMLANRPKFQDHLEGAIVGTREGEYGFALLCLDLDGFKLVNDTRGHGIGDKLLVAVAQRLRKTVRGSDVIARIGGDEFAIIQAAGNQPQAARALAGHLLRTISEPFELENQRSVIGVSIGIALFPQDGGNPELLLRNADVALYQAKEAGRNTFRFFNSEMQTSRQQRFLIEQDLRDAVAGEHFALAYQPIRDCQSLRVVGFEALLRWNHESRGVILPDQFIPFAETTGLIVPLGYWALETACREAVTWDSSVSLSVNLSPLQFRQADLLERIVDILERTRMPAERLELEVTEGLLLDTSEAVLGRMRGLREYGIRIALDDFGAAYGGLNYLRCFPFDRIKIDRSFVREIWTNPVTHAIVQNILSLGDSLNLPVVAEGIETEQELEALRKLGCRLVQGYLLGKPMSGARARALLQEPDPLAALMRR